MKNILKSIFLLAVVAFASCNDLTEEVYSDLTEDGYKYKESEIYAVIGPVYSNLRGLHHHRGFSALQMTSTDILCMPANASGWDDAGVYKKLHFHTWNSEAKQVGSAWSQLYSGVLHANRIISQLESGQVPVPASENVESLIAEIKVMRALYHWFLMDNFGDTPYLDQVTQELPAVTPREQIYENIVADITASMDKLSAENDLKHYARMNKWGAKALLANIYLNAEVYTGQSQWEKCMALCNEIIAANKYQLQPDYKDCFDFDNDNSVENIFVIAYDELNGGGLWINHTFHAASKAKYDMKNTPWGAGSLKAVSQFIDTYEEGDYRLDVTWEHGLQFASDGITPLLCTYDRAGEQLNYSKDLPNGNYTAEDEGYRVKKFLPKIGSERNLDNDFPIFRYAQVLMMKAECLLRTGKADEAATIVTEVRQRAFKTNPDKATVTAADLTTNTSYKFGYVEDYKIVEQGDQSPVEFGGFYDELGYEFAAEWVRRRDMIRFGTYTTKSWLSHKPQGDYRIVFPLPKGAIDTNPNLEQHPNY
ncbi:RagB/SusD family nutrient uptake outer membrane protein [Prolixibacteraceae bacterium JC049]|nr:RagB/SusD family nutrient uptake outer membrane protein [Prolixibacteraceae bacterium JC049]